MFDTHSLKEERLWFQKRQSVLGWLQGRDIMAEGVAEQRCLVHIIWGAEQENHIRKEEGRAPYTVPKIEPPWPTQTQLGPARHLLVQ